ncbi:MAG TPA: DUF1549 and DUF1553 domain-containing protein, partial [Bryobacteraceae bacterium]|nr:DUF1549 and DUF1553 domain-containing protein [Bryobacteraceae bacterium]
IAAISEWVKMGAPMPATGAAAPVAAIPAKKKEFTRGQKEFWSFRPVRPHPVPAVQDAAWPKNAIDNFMLAKMEEKKVRPAPPADKVALLRRATFDLIGLPPTQNELDDFLADKSPAAFEKVIDRLLASPRYGERWGRHWLDVARYADSTGADEDHRYPYAWRYRDYVIDAFNKDLPYDQFVKEQIAGDLLPAKDGSVNVNGIVATGFLAIGPRLIAEQDKLKMLYDFIDEQIDTTSRAFLGLTVACARCHDHKFDPIPTKDYYSMAAIFANTKAFKKIEGTVSQMYDAPLVSKPVFDDYEAHQHKVNGVKKKLETIVEMENERHVDSMKSRVDDYMTAAYRVLRQSENEAKLAGSMGLRPEILSRWITFLKPGSEPRPFLDAFEKASPDTLAQVTQAYESEFLSSYKAWEAKAAQWQKKVDEAIAKGEDPPEKPKMGESKSPFFTGVLAKEGPFAFDEQTRDSFYTPEIKARIASLKTQEEELKKVAPPEPAMATAVTEGAPVVQKVFIRGDAANPGEPVEKRFLSIIAGDDQPPIRRGSGRLEFAQWLTDGKHPLTARVMVNRIWQGHFSEGLVRTPSNWGLMGEKPTHPELLDFLAAKFVENGWSVKTMHRMIMLSSTYQQSSQISKLKADTDPANRLWSRFPRRRLDVEEIRDGMLAIDGSLDLTMGGTLQSGKGTDGENAEGRKSISPETVKRRTVYLPLRRSNLPTLLNLFDFGDATTTNEGRARTNVAPQALFMMNSKFVTERAETLAKQLLSNANLDDRGRVTAAYSRILSRQPAADEIGGALDYVKSVAAQRPGDTAVLQSWQSLCRILLASNEFMYLD